MGLSTKKTKSTTNQNTSATVTPTNLPGIDTQISGLAGRIGDTFKGLDPYSLVPGADPLQTQAASSAAGLGTFTGYGGGTQAAPGGPSIGATLSGLSGKVATAQANYDPSKFGNAPTGDTSYASTDSFGASPPGAPQGGPMGQAGVYQPTDPSSSYANVGPPTANTGAAFGAGAPSSGNPYGDAMNTLRDVSTTGGSSVQAGDIAGNISGLMNPYVKDVRDTAIADYNQGAGYTRAENKLSLAGDTTFGGSGGAIQTALSNDAIDRGRGTLSAGIMKDGFDRAAALATQQAGFNQQASLANGQFNEQALGRQAGAAAGLAGVAGAQGADTRANIGAQADMGNILRQIAAAKAGAPIAALGAESSLLSGLPLDLFKGQNATGSLSGTSTTKESGASLTDWLNFFAANASSAASGAGA